MGPKMYFALKKGNMLLFHAFWHTNNSPFSITFR